MSFSSGVKDELSRHQTLARHCQIAEIAAIISMCGGVSISEKDHYSLKIQTENVYVARKYFTLLKKTYNIDTDVKISEEQMRSVIDKIGDLSEPVSPLLIKNSCCQRAFLRGAFLCIGSMSDPQKSYHLEFVCTDEDKARQLQSVIQGFDIEAKIVLRKKYYVVYLKEGSGIVDLLNVCEAPIALMKLENLRIVKEMRNSVNRKVNCETANINKTVNAAVKQIEDIRLLEEKVGLESLSEGLEEIARLRLQYPEATLKELGLMLNPQVGKSGVNHRLRKLSLLADDLRENKEELL